jgi:hypothetical protein
MEEAMERLASMELWRYDSLVLAIGANNSLLLTPVDVWQRSLERVLSYLDEKVATGTGIYLVAVPPISSIDVHAGYIGWLADRHANRLNAETRKVAARFSNVTFIPFSPLVKADFSRYRSSATYQQWAGVIAAPLIKDLRGDDRSDPEVRQNELARQRALEIVGILDSEVEERFTRIATLGSQLFGCEQTVIGFVDRDRLWLKAVSAPTELGALDYPRVGSFADWTIRQHSAFVVTDATKDPRFAQHPAVTGSARIRFFAGYPIESPFGERIGVIGALSTETRSWSDSETTLLRDLALMVQRELAGG